MAQPSPTPVRFPSGLSTDFPYGPLANFGMPNPFAYAVHSDDFMEYFTAGKYTATLTGNGTIAKTDGTGGRVLFTTNSSTPAATDIASLQLVNTAFTLVAGKKAFFATRIQLSSASNAMFRAGFLQTTTTPWTAVNGIYFDKPTGALNNLRLINTVASVDTTTVIPTSAYSLANATDIDLAFYVDRSGTINGFIGSQLFGWLPQSGTGSAPPARGVAFSVTPTLPSATMNLVLALRSGTAASSTMTADFLFAAVER